VKAKATVNHGNIEYVMEPTLSASIIRLSNFTSYIYLQPAKARVFEECRGYVVAAYQDFLEKKWLDDLKKKYPVSINKDVFESLGEKIEQNFVDILEG
jgi:hypothetical protein